MSRRKPVAFKLKHSCVILTDIVLNTNSMNSTTFTFAVLGYNSRNFLNFLLGFSPKMIYGPTSDVDVYDSSEYLELSKYYSFFSPPRNQSHAPKRNSRLLYRGEQTKYVKN